MMSYRSPSVGGVLAALGLGLALLLVPASQATAASCDGALKGAGPSGWQSDGEDGEFEEAMLLTSVGLDALRDDALDDYGEPEINDSGYQNNSEAGCKQSKRTNEIVFPTRTVEGVAVTPQLYASKRKPFARQYVSLRNPGPGPVTVDFGWDGDLGSDGGTRVAKSSSGDATATAGDRWATSCEDDEGDGCAKTVGDDVDRDPELAHNWRGKGAPASPSAVILATGDGDFDVTFANVTIGPGKTVAFMQVVSLAPKIKAANRAAQAIDRNPAKYGVFKALSKKERKRLRNW